MHVVFLRPDFRQREGDQQGFGTVDIALSSLERHGGRVLDPAQAETVGDRRVRPTAYRWRYLLVPDDVLQDPDAMGLINGAMQELGLQDLMSRLNEI